MLRINSDGSTPTPVLADPLRGTRATNTASVATPAAAPPPDPQAQAQASARQPTIAELQHAVDTVNHAIGLRNTNLKFEIDQKTVVTKVVDSSTGEVLRQIPSEDVLRLSRAIAADLEHETGALGLVRAKA